MTPIQVVAEFARQVESAKSRGNTEVTIDSLETYLEALRENIERQSPLAAANVEFQAQAIEHAYRSEHEMFRTVIESGQAALKANLLIGGGAAAALLAFASSAWKSLSPEGLALLGLTVFLLACGVLLVGVAGGLTYLSQSSYHNGLREPAGCRQDRVGDWLRRLASVLAAGAYLLYGFSCWNIYRVMSSFSIDTYFPVG